MVSGAAAGIGRACCEVLADLGASVIGVDIDPEFDGYRYDVSVEEQVRELGRRVSGEHERLAAVVNVAGIGDAELLANEDAATWNRVLQVSLSSVFLMTREFLPLVAAGEGAFVNIASTYALASRPRHGAYSAAKGGIVSLTKAVAVEAAASGVRANAVCPGPVETPRRKARFDSGEDNRERAAGRTLLGRLAEPAEVAYLVAFLASRAASYITGSAFVIDGGQLAHIGDVS